MENDGYGVEYKGNKGEIVLRVVFYVIRPMRLGGTPFVRRKGVNLFVSMPSLVWLYKHKFRLGTQYCNIRTEVCATGNKGEGIVGNRKQTHETWRSNENIFTLGEDIKKGDEC